MSHAFVCNIMHCTFSTKERYPWIDSEVETRLWPYIGGIVRENRMKALAIGGVFDHLHALLSLPGAMSFAKAVQLIKGGSSKWIHEEIGLRKFEWQEGYGAFSVSQSPAEKDHCLYHQSKKASSKANIQRRVPEAVGQAWRGI